MCWICSLEIRGSTVLWVVLWHSRLQQEMSDINQRLLTKDSAEKTLEELKSISNRPLLGGVRPKQAKEKPIDSRRSRSGSMGPSLGRRDVGKGKQL